MQTYALNMTPDLTISLLLPVYSWNPLSNPAHFHAIDFFYDFLHLSLKSPPTGRRLLILPLSMNCHCELLVKYSLAYKQITKSQTFQ